jgi:hypothetical protein
MKRLLSHLNTPVPGRFSFWASVIGGTAALSLLAAGLVAWRWL